MDWLHSTRLCHPDRWRFGATVINGRHLVAITVNVGPDAVIIKWVAYIIIASLEPNAILGCIKLSIASLAANGNGDLKGIVSERKRGTEVSADVLQTTACRETNCFIRAASKVQTSRSRPTYHSRERGDCLTTKRHQGTGGTTILNVKDASTKRRRIQPIY